MAAKDAVTCERVEERSSRIEVKVLAELTCSVYDAAFGTSAQSKGTDWPGAKRAPEAGDSSVGAGSGPSGIGFTVNVAVLLTPAPDTDSVTMVVAAGLVVRTRTPACGEPAGIVTVGAIQAMLGSLLVRVKVTSVVCIAAMATRADEPCDPMVVTGSTVHSAGGTPGSSVSWCVTCSPFQLAVIVTVVATATALVAMVKS